MALLYALAINLYVLMVALPLGLAAHARALSPMLAGVLSGALLVPVLVPVMIFVPGIVRVPASVRTAALFVVTPLGCALPETLFAGALEPLVPASASLVAAASLVAYLAAAAHLETRASRRQAEANVRRLKQDPLPSRWRRRLRVYRGLTALALVIPLVLIGSVAASGSFAAALAVSFGDEAARARTFAVVGAGLLSVILWRAYLVAPLAGHLQHDRDLYTVIELDRRHARRGRPRAGFYFAVLLALVAMAGVIWQRAK